MRSILTLKVKPQPKPEPVAVVEVAAPVQPEAPKETSPMRVVDRHGTLSIRKRDVFERKGTALRAVAAEFFVVDDEVLKTADLSVAIVGKPHSTLAAARQSIGRVVPDNNENKTKPKSAYSAFSGPAHCRRGASK